MPQIEEREACRVSGYNWKEWQGLPYDERVVCVAYFRVRRRIDMNQDDARDQHTQRQRNMQKRKRRR